MGRRSMPPQMSRPTSPSRFHLPNIIRSSSSERALANSTRLKRQSSFSHHQHVTMPEDITRRIQQQRHHSRTVDDDEEDDDVAQLRALPARMSTMMVVRHLEGPSTSSKKGPHEDIDEDDDDEDDDIRGSSLFLSDRSASDMVLLHQQHRLETTQSSSPSPPQRRVSFGVCQVRSYRQVLGDHPCCETGCPLSLGWEYHVEETVDVDELNPTSIVAANDGDKRPCPKLTLEERRARLGGACSDADIRRIARRRHRDRECAARSAKGFFSCGASSATRKCHKSKAAAAAATPCSNTTVEDSGEEEEDASVPTTTTVQEQ